MCLWFLEHITAGKTNLPAIVLIKVLFLRLTLNGRQPQLHKMTGTQRGCLPRPRWHMLWTSTNFKRYSLSDYWLKDRVRKENGGKINVSIISEISKHWHCAYKPADVIPHQQSGLIIKDDRKGELNKIDQIQKDVLQNGNCCTFLLWKNRVLHKDEVGSLVESEWVSALLRQPINQPFKHLSPPLPVSALRSTAAARGPQEATGWGFSKPIFSF